jgi:hypothetical protein
VVKRLPACFFDADLGDSTGDDQGFHAQRAQDVFQIGVVERAVSVFIYDMVARLRIDLVDHGIAGGRASKPVAAVPIVVTIPKSGSDWAWPGSGCR